MFLEMLFRRCNRMHLGKLREQARKLEDEISASATMMSDLSLYINKETSKAKRAVLKNQHRQAEQRKLLAEAALKLTKESIAFLTS